jgi:hypothetical protein
VQHQLVAAHVDNDLSVIGSSLLVELRRNHNAKTRGLALVHGNKKEIPVSETEQGRFGRIVKIDLRQVSELCRNVERQTSGVQKGARDRLMSCGGSRARRGRQGDARDKCDRDTADNGLEQYLATYLDIVRPQMLRDPTCAALWLNSRGGALAYAKISDIIAHHSTTRLGLRITTHDVRDAAATTWAIFKPEQIGVARDLLGHSDLRTTSGYYIRARGIEVSRAHNQLIAAIRRKRRHRG